MIECEMCENYFHVDDIKNCPKCGMELCESCFEKHVLDCLNLDEDDIIENDESVPRVCPLCGEELELDINYSNSGEGLILELICSNSNCDFMLDVTDVLGKNGEDD